MSALKFVIHIVDQEFRREGSETCLSAERSRFAIQSLKLPDQIGRIHSVATSQQCEICVLSSKSKTASRDTTKPLLSERIFPKL